VAHAGRTKPVSLGFSNDTRLNHANLKKTLRTRGVIEFSTDIFRMLSEMPRGAALYRRTSSPQCFEIVAFSSSCHGAAGEK
jgi:hypothetical protein